MRRDYYERIERAVKYIHDHYDEPIHLDTLANVSHFSKYHFNRIFTSIVGMTPMSYVKKIRLQKSVYYLTETTKSILEISNLCGFGSVSNFNAAFKQHFHMVPSDVRKKHQNRNISLDISKNQEEWSAPIRYTYANHHLLRRIWSMNITIKELPDYEVAFVRHVGSYLETYYAWNQLNEWANRNGLYPPEHDFIGISLDDPLVVEEFACRYDACVTLPTGFKGEEDPDIQYKTIPGGLYALYQFYDTIDKLAIAYQSLFGQWLPNSEYDADDRPCLEFCMNNPETDPEGKCKVHLYVPIKERGSSSGG
jgi:AraC family transcriptional regulator